MKPVDGWRGIRLRTEEDARRDVVNVVSDIRLVPKNTLPPKSQSENGHYKSLRTTDEGEGFSDWLKAEGVAE